MCAGSIHLSTGLLPFIRLWLLVCSVSASSWSNGYIIYSEDLFEFYMILIKLFFLCSSRILDIGVRPSSPKIATFRTDVFTCNIRFHNWVQSLNILSLIETPYSWDVVYNNIQYNIYLISINRHSSQHIYKQNKNERAAIRLHMYVQRGNLYIQFTRF
jgi:hypothetical protein